MQSFQEDLTLVKVVITNTYSTPVEVCADFRDAYQELAAVKSLSTHHTRTGRMLVCLVTDPEMRTRPALNYGGALCDSE